MTLSLLEIGKRYGTDKVTRHDYHLAYERHLGQLKKKPRRLLEIGVFGGASIRMWEEFLPDTEIIGVDSDPKCADLKFDRASVIIGKQEDEGFLSELASTRGPFDVVIDDGGHRMSEQQASFCVLFPSINKGGLYVIEDLETSYYTRYAGGFRSHTSTVEAIKGIIDSMHRRFHGLGMSVLPAPVAGLHVYRNICFIERG